MANKLGFTLIELLIVIAILAIIAGIAYPSYQDFVIQAKRNDAQGELIKAQIEQSSHRIINPSYITNINSAGLPSNDPNYTFSIESAGSSTYLMKAIVKSTSNTQVNDTDICQTLYIDQDSNKTSNGNTDNSSCWRN